MRWPRWAILSLAAFALLPCILPYLLVAVPGWHESLPIKLFAILAHAAPVHPGVPFHYALLARLSQAGYTFGNPDVLWQAQAVLWVWWLGKGPLTWRASAVQIMLAIAAWLVFAVVGGGELQENPQSPVIITWLLFVWILLPRNRRMPVALLR